MPRAGGTDVTADDNLRSISINGIYVIGFQLRTQVRQEVTSDGCEVCQVNCAPINSGRDPAGPFPRLTQTREIGA